MNKIPEQTKILFLQARNDEMKEHEFLCYDRSIPVPQENFFRLDVYQDKIETKHLDNIDVVILAGTGQFYYGSDHPDSLPDIIELLKEARSRRLPILGIGYGHEVLAMAFGGEVVNDPSLKEIGTIDLYLTKHAKTDPIFSLMPERLKVQIGHNHSVKKPPEGSVELVKSNKGCCDAFTFPGEPIYAMQFHPELEHSDLVIRLNFYQKTYFDQTKALDKVIAGLKHSPQASQILSHFINEVVCKN